MKFIHSFGVKVMRIILALAAVVCISCTTTYQKNGPLTEGGYEDIQLDSNVFQVSFYGNEATPSSAVSEMALLRCSQLAMVRGFQFFSIAENNLEKSSYSIILPATTTTNTSVNAYGNSAAATSNSTTYGGGPVTLTKADSRVVIVGYRERPIEGGIPTYNSKMVCEGLAPRHGTMCFTSAKAEAIHAEKKQKQAESVNAATWVSMFLGVALILIVLGNS